MISLSEVVLDVVVLGRYAQLDELVLKRATLLKKQCTLPFISIALSVVSFTLYLTLCLSFRQFLDVHLCDVLQRQSQSVCQY